MPRASMCGDGSTAWRQLSAADDDFEPSPVVVPEDTPGPRSGPVRREWTWLVTLLGRRRPVDQR